MPLSFALNNSPSKYNPSCASFCVSPKFEVFCANELFFVQKNCVLYFSLISSWFIMKLLCFTFDIYAISVWLCFEIRIILT